jgi:hypothetical protein
MRRGLRHAAGVLLAHAPCSGGTAAAAGGAAALHSAAAGRAWPSLLPSTQGLAAAGSAALAARLGLQALLAQRLGPAAIAVSGPAAAALAPPAAAVAGSSAAGGGLLLAAAPLLGRPRAGAAPTPVLKVAPSPAPASGARAFHGRWALFQRPFGVTEALMALNVGMFGLQKAYPSLVLKLARVRARGLRLGQPGGPPSGTASACGGAAQAWRGARRPLPPLASPCSLPLPLPPPPSLARDGRAHCCRPPLPKKTSPRPAPPRPGPGQPPHQPGRAVAPPNARAAARRPVQPGHQHAVPLPDRPVHRGRAWARPLRRCVRRRRGRRQRPRVGDGHARLLDGGRRVVVDIRALRRLRCVPLAQPGALRPQRQRARLVRAGAGRRAARPRAPPAGAGGCAVRPGPGISAPCRRCAAPPLPKTPHIPPFP